MIKLIHLDLDAVIAKFDKAACMAHGLNIQDPIVRKACIDNKLYDLVGGKGNFWKVIDALGQDFWENIELTEYAEDLYQFLNHISNGHVYFLTSPSTNPVCCSGKARWIQKHFKGTRKFLIGPAKYACASSHSLLVDDNEKKINQYKEWGGQVYKFPSYLLIEDQQYSIWNIMEEIGSIVNANSYSS